MNQHHLSEHQIGNRYACLRWEQVPSAAIEYGCSLVPELQKLRGLMTCDSVVLDARSCKPSWGRRLSCRGTALNDRVPTTDPRSKLWMPRS